MPRKNHLKSSISHLATKLHVKANRLLLILPATAGSVFKSFEKVFLETLPSAYMVGFPHHLMATYKCNVIMMQ